VSSGLSDRDRRALLWGGAAVAVLLLYLLLRDGGSAPPPAEQIQADVQATMPESPPPVVAVAPPPVVVAATPVVDVSQLHLVGLLSSGAVIAMADGSQHFVPVGREVVPGVTLRGVDVHQAILATGAGEVRLGFDAGAQPQAPVIVVPAGTPPRP
jgi:hypothetical protein